ncbi:beta-lactamase [Staphylococcus aureus]|nr:beta-lactamase [Staphylococcus aureus]
MFSTPSNFSKLNNINITRQNVGEEDFNKVLNGNTTWNTLTEKLESKGLITKGQKVTIHSNSTTVSGVVGEKLTNSNDINLEKRFINKITIE